MNFKHYLEINEGLQEIFALTEAEVLGRDFVLSSLEKYASIIKYIVQHKLHSVDDLNRLKKFTSMIQTNLPEFDKAIEQIKNDLETAKAFKSGGNPNVLRWKHGDAHA